MITTLIAFIVILGFLVLVHELGHFITAKKNGIAVEEFGLGFPPRIYQKRFGETLYTLNAIPLGGYVKIKGEEGSAHPDADSFSAKPIWRRLLVLVAGVIMNVLAGWFLLVVLFMVGAPSKVTGYTHTETISQRSIVVSSVLADSPAEHAGLMSGDEILSVNDISFATIDDFQKYVDLSDALSITYKRGTGVFEAMIRPVTMPERDIDRRVIGISLAEIGIIRLPPHRAVIAGTEAAGAYIHMIVSAFGGIIRSAVQGNSVSDSLGGPVAIAVATNDVLGLGVAHVLIFIAVLSFNLAIINILPFPALDGGRILFLLVEAIRGKPSRQEVEAWFHRVGFVLLMLLAVVITYHDVARFGGRIWRAIIG